jgi:hypothetical protein
MYKHLDHRTEAILVNSALKDLNRDLEYTTRIRKLRRYVMLWTFAWLQLRYIEEGMDSTGIKKLDLVRDFTNALNNSKGS